MQNLDKRRNLAHDARPTIRHFPAQSSPVCAEERPGRGRPTRSAGVGRFRMRRWSCLDCPVILAQTAPPGTVRLRLICSPPPSRDFAGILKIPWEQEDSLGTGKITAKVPDSSRPRAKRSCTIRCLGIQFPTRPNGEIILSGREINRPIREVSARAEIAPSAGKLQVPSARPKHCHNTERYNRQSGHRDGGNA
jgi:hypothetical protein